MLFFYDLGRGKNIILPKILSLRPPSEAISTQRQYANQAKYIDTPWSSFELFGNNAEQQTYRATLKSLQKAGYINILFFAPDSTDFDLQILRPIPTEIKYTEVILNLIKLTPSSVSKKKVSLQDWLHTQTSGPHLQTCSLENRIEEWKKLVPLPCSKEIPDISFDLDDCPLTEPVNLIADIHGVLPALVEQMLEKGIAAFPAETSESEPDLVFIDLQNRRVFFTESAIPDNARAFTVKIPNLKVNPDCFRTIFLGDLVDRGGDSDECLALAWYLQHQNPDKIVLLAGNHEVNIALNKLMLPLPNGEVVSYGNAKILKSMLADGTFRAAADIDGAIFCSHSFPTPEFLYGLRKALCHILTFEEDSPFKRTSFSFSKERVSKLSQGKKKLIMQRWHSILLMPDLTFEAITKAFQAIESQKIDPEDLATLAQITSGLFRFALKEKSSLPHQDPSKSDPLTEEINFLQASLLKHFLLNTSIFKARPNKDRPFEYMNIACGHTKRPTLQKIAGTKTVIFDTSILKTLANEPGPQCVRVGTDGKIYISDTFFQLRYPKDCS